MNKIFFIFALLMGKIVLSQEEKLYYFYTQDSTLVGVKNDKGKVIIPALFWGAKVYDTELPINEPTIEFWGTPSLKNRKYSRKNPRIEAGEVYDRKGRFLYYPLWFDNGNDYWSEGLRRYVEKDKIGFVDWFGKKVIPAQWAFASEFSYGYAVVYVGGWKKKYEKGGEHWMIVPTSKKSTSYIINKEGKKVTPSPKPKHPKDYFYKGEYYPYPFVYNDFEQKIVNGVNQLKILKEIQYYHKDTNPHYEIIDRPNQYLPYYHLKLFYGKEKYGGVDDIWVNKKGEIFLQDYGEKFIPLKDHTKKILERIVEDQKEGYKDESYPIKAQKILKELENYQFKVKM